MGGTRDACSHSWVAACGVGGSQGTKSRHDAQENGKNLVVSYGVSRLHTSTLDANARHIGMEGSNFDQLRGLAVN